jgi:hypothetical protein
MDNVQEVNYRSNMKLTSKLDTAFMRVNFMLLIRVFVCSIPCHKADYVTENCL